MIRQAVAEDGNGCLSLMKQFFEELATFPSDVRYGWALFSYYHQSPDTLALVYEEDGKIRGVLLAHSGDHDMGPMKVACEKLWFIQKEYRGRAWRPMMRAFESWAKDRGCACLSMTALAGNSGVGRLYERAGYVPLETTYLKRL